MQVNSPYQCHRIRFYACDVQFIPFIIQLLFVERLLLLLLLLSFYSLLILVCMYVIMTCSLYLYTNFMNEFDSLSMSFCSSAVNLFQFWLRSKCEWAHFLLVEIIYFVSNFDANEFINDWWISIIVKYRIALPHTCPPLSVFRCV